MADLQAVKAMSKARDAEERRGQERRRNVVVLILRHLADYGYVDAYERLSAESQLSLGRLDAADNMDLVGILQEFEEGYEQRFGRRPKLVRRVAEEVRRHPPPVHSAARRPVALFTWRCAADGWMSGS